MDAKVKKSCPSCSQPFSMKSQQAKCRLPLLLKCSHTICEACVRNMLKFSEPIDCKVCQQDTVLQPNDVMLLKTDLYAVFPVNIYMLGELALQSLEDSASAHGADKYGTSDKDCYIDLKAILNTIEGTEDHCVECQNPTSKMCKQCCTVLCENCFNKTHKFHIFKNHILKNIESDIEPSYCNAHPEKLLEYFCKSCEKCVCMDCMIVGGEKSCKNHDIVSTKDMNEGVIDQLNEINLKIDEIYKRLTKTALVIGNRLKIVDDDNTSDINIIQSNIQLSFSKLHVLIQKQEQDIMDLISKMRSTEVYSLQKAKTNVANYIKKSKQMHKKINMIMQSENRNKTNLFVILEEAKEILKTPWYLMKMETKDQPLKVTINEDVYKHLGNFASLEGSTEMSYKLLSEEEISEEQKTPAPPKALFPPEILRDVREFDKPKEVFAPTNSSQHSSNMTVSFFANAPKYRRKHQGSTSSLNSLESDSSFKKFVSGSGEGYAPKVHPVQPFPESNQPKQLYEGSQELIYISHIIGPHNFYVQRAHHQNLVKELIREFRTANNLPKPSHNHIGEGKIYLAYNKSDNEWQRCRVMTVDRIDPNKLKCRVFCFDFGNTETVSSDNLRLLPSARLHSPPPLALKCSLANCEPKSGAWNTEDAVLIQQIVNNKQAVMHVRRIHSTGYTVRLECDITTYDEAVSLAHALVFLERAKMPFPDLPYLLIRGLSEKPELFINFSDLSANSVETVLITHVISPDKFYVRKDPYTDMYEKLCDSLEDEYSLSVNFGSIYCPEIGMVCVVNIERNRGEVDSVTGSWRRAIVKDTPGRQRVRVYLPDSGHSIIVHWSMLRRIQPRYTIAKGLADECHLSGVTPLNKRWSTSSVMLMQSFLMRKLEMRVEELNHNRASVGVSVYDKTDPENVVCINEMMVKHKFAVTVGVFMFNRDQVIEQQCVTFTKKNMPNKPKPVPKPKKNTITVLKRNEPLKQQKPEVADTEELDAKDKGPFKLAVRVLKYHSPSHIYVALLDHENNYSELYAKIQEHYSKNTGGEKDNWEVGDKCCCLSKESNTWRRAIVMEIIEDKSKVFFCDFATTETILLSSLRVLAPEFMEIGEAAIRCHLAGVVPAVGDEWPSITKEFLQELIEAYQTVFLTRLGSVKNGSLAVQMWAYHVIQGGALEPDTAEWRCFNQRIIEQGLGIPAKVEDEDLQEETDIFSIFNLTGQLREWLKLETTCKPKSNKPATSLVYNTVVEEDEETSSNEENKGHKTHVTDWLPPEPLAANEFTAMPTYIDNSGVIYLHDAAQRDTLELIGNALEVRFKYDETKKVTNWCVGQPVIARFYLDGRFYRGRVLEVNKTTSVCIIHYIDYGNDEACAFEDMRNSIALYDIPTQAHRCCLARIKPTRDIWDKTTLDYIHKAIVEKDCLVKVVGESVNDVVPIELKFRELCLNDHLVEFEMAVYLDGTKPVKRKFKKQPEETIVVLNSSDPDYLLENESEQVDMKNADWNAIIAEDESKQNLDSSFFSFLTNGVPDEFPCHVVLITDDVFELTVIQEEEEALKYQEMYDQLQNSDEASPINGIYKDKACLARYNDDGKWYRAKILEHSAAKSLIKVKYIDFGNIDVVPMEDVREISLELTSLPPASVTAKLHGVAIPTDTDTSLIDAELESTFLTNTVFNAIVINKASNPIEVELRDDDGKLVYEDLLASGILVEVETD